MLLPPQYFLIYFTHPNALEVHLIRHVHLTSQVGSPDSIYPPHYPSSSRDNAERLNAYLICRFEAGVCDFCDCQLFVISLFSGNDGSVGCEGEVNTRVGHLEEITRV